MKKFFKWFFIVSVSAFFMTVLGFLLILFFKPTVIINPKTINYGLTKTSLLKKWSWSDARFEHQWKKWNERVFKGYFRNLCLSYDSEIASLDTCIEVISWNFDILYHFKQGLRSRAIDPILIRSSKFKFVLKKMPENNKPKGPPLAVWDYWKMLWSDLIPDVDVKFTNIALAFNKKEYTFDLSLVKTPGALTANARGFGLVATFDKFELSAPKKYLLPYDLKTSKPLYFHDLKLTAIMKETGIPIKLTGSLEAVIIEMNSNVSLPLKNEFTSLAFKRQTLLATSASLRLPEVQKNLHKFGPKPYHNLPAPLSSMDGFINIFIKTNPTPDPSVVGIEAIMNIDLKSQKQVFIVDLTAGTPLDVTTYKPGPISVGVDFRKVTLMMPRLSKKSLPPQFFEDKRIKAAPYKEAQNKTKPPEKFELILNPQALGDRAMHLKTNLLDEVLRLNFDLFINSGEVKDGFLEALPLKTTIFKRPVKLKHMRIDFNHPLEPVIKASINLPLPEYKITINIEGPLSKPRHSFTSVPPLPQNDIFAVILFGRPLADLDPDDKTAASKTNQLLSQGILSLSVLYFLSGSSVEYVGYDPNSENATAQVGLGHKSSLRIGGNGQGVNSTAVRRSLGKGWYLDTSVQNSTESDVKNYGVLLERIIAY